MTGTAVAARGFARRLFPPSCTDISRAWARRCHGGARYSRLVNGQYLSSATTAQMQEMKELTFQLPPCLETSRRLVDSRLSNLLSSKPGLATDCTQLTEFPVRTRL